MRDLRTHGVSGESLLRKAPGERARRRLFRECPDGLQLDGLTMISLRTGVMNVEDFQRKGWSFRDMCAGRQESH